MEKPVPPGLAALKRSSEGGVDSSVLERRLARATSARKAAERLLEEKSRELFAANEELTRANAQLAVALDEAREVTERNRRMALHDQLTNLPNRRFIQDWLQREAEVIASGGERALVVLQIDLYRFQQINETFGHAAGDAALIATARTLTELLERAVARGFFLQPSERPPALARLGGDKFAIAGFQKAGSADLAAFGEEIVDALSTIAISPSINARIGATVGVVRVSCDSADLDPATLLSAADLATYRAMAAGRGTVVFYSDEMRAETLARKKLSDELLAALEHGEFQPYYQPQVDARTRRIVGAEALARWIRPNGEVRGPAAFLDCVEDLGLLHAVDAQIADRAAADRAAWRAEGLELGKLSLNVSFGRLTDPRLGRSVSTLAAGGLVAIELLESVLLDQIDPEIERALSTIAAGGALIEIDDFGSGHASIIGLMKLKPSRIKLDRQLVAPILDSAEHRQVVASVVHMAQAMGVAVTGEGVETEAQADALCAVGCDVLQGYFLGRPMPADAFAARLREDRDAVGS